MAELPGVGKVKKPWLYAAGAALVAIVGYGYIKSRRATAQASTDTGSQDPIDPATGLPYSQESGVYGFGGTDPSTGVPYIYENQNQPTSSTTGQQFTTNSAWLSQAQQDAQNLFGATYALATTALGKYIAQTPSGLADDEYQLVSEVVAELGQPPVNQPFRLIHAQQSVTTPPPPDNNPPPDNSPPPTDNNPPPSSAPTTTTVTVVPFGNPAPWNSTMWGIANHFGISLAKLEAANPSVTPPQFIIHPGQKITVPLS